MDISGIDRVNSFPQHEALYLKNLNMYPFYVLIQESYYHDNIVATGRERFNPLKKICK